MFAAATATATVLLARQLPRVVALRHCGFNMHGIPWETSSPLPMRFNKVVDDKNTKLYNSILGDITYRSDIDSINPSGIDTNKTAATAANVFASGYLRRSGPRAYYLDNNSYGDKFVFQSSGDEVVVPALLVVSVLGLGYLSVNALSSMDEKKK